MTDNTKLARELCNRYGIPYTANEDMDYLLDSEREKHKKMDIMKDMMIEQTKKWWMDSAVKNYRQNINGVSSANGITIILILWLLVLINAW